MAVHVKLEGSFLWMKNVIIHSHVRTSCNFIVKLVAARCHRDNSVTVREQLGHKPQILLKGRGVRREL